MRGTNSEGAHGGRQGIRNTLGRNSFSRFSRHASVSHFWFFMLYLYINISLLVVLFSRKKKLAFRREKTNGNVYLLCTAGLPETKNETAPPVHPKPPGRQRKLDTMSKNRRGVAHSRRTRLRRQRRLSPTPRRRDILLLADNDEPTSEANTLADLCPDSEQSLDFDPRMVKHENNVSLYI